MAGLLDIPSRETLRQHGENVQLGMEDDRRREAARAAGLPAPDGTSRNLEYIGKQMFNAVDDMAKASALFSASILDKLGLPGSDYFARQLHVPSPVTLPNPAQINAAGQIIGDVARGLLPFMLPGAGLPIGVATTGSKTGMERIEQGVDEATASASAITAAGSAAAFAGLGKLAGTGQTMLGTIGRQAIVNVPTGMVTRGIERQILADQYPELAEQVKIIGAKEVGLDVALSVLFGGLSHRSAINEVRSKTGKSEAEAAATVAKAEDIISTDTALEDAVRTRQTHEQVKEMNPLEGDAAWERHTAALDKTMRDIESLQPIDLDMDITDLNPAARTQAETLATSVEAARQELLPVPRDAEPGTIDVPRSDGSVLRLNEAELKGIEVEVDAADESGAVQKIKMTADEAIKQYEKTNNLLADILACVRGA